MSENKINEGYYDPFEEILKSRSIIKAIEIMDAENLSIQDTMAELYQNAQYASFIPVGWQDQYYSYIASFEEKYNLHFAELEIKEKHQKQQAREDRAYELRRKREKMEVKVFETGQKILLRSMIPFYLSIAGFIYYGSNLENSEKNYSIHCTPQPQEINLYDKLINAEGSYQTNRTNSKCELSQNKRMFFSSALGAFGSIPAGGLLALGLTLSRKKIARHLIKDDQED